MLPGRGCLSTNWSSPEWGLKKKKKKTKKEQKRHSTISTAKPHDFKKLTAMRFDKHEVFNFLKS